MFTTKGEFRAGVAYDFDANTTETVASNAPFAFNDEFVGAGHSAGVPAAGSPVAGYAWVKKIVGSAPPTVAQPSGANAGGTMACSLTSTSEAEEASLYFHDSLQIDTTKIGEVEWRAALSTLPTLNAQIALGVGSAWVGGPLNLARYLMFVWNNSSTPQIYWKDGGSNSGSLTAAPIGGSAIVTDTNMHLYRIDWSNPADIAFLIDGNRVNAAGSVQWAPSGTNGVFQPWQTVYKASGAGLGVLAVDKIDIGNGR